MTFHIKLETDKEAANIAERNHLEKWGNENKTVYKSGKVGNFDGITFDIKDKKMKIVCSLHKAYIKIVLEQDRLDNSGLFTISEAHRSLNALFNHIGIEKEHAEIKYFEIGLNLPTKYEAVEYIKPMISITSGVRDIDKAWFEDANFEENRQKTTRKVKTIKKVFKAYDKEHEQAQKHREQPTGEHILRIETMYRRQNIPVLDFFSNEHINRLKQCFYDDWARVEFKRDITADKGVHSGQIENAKNILLFGRENYLQRAKADYKAGVLSERKYRTIQEFVRDWNSNKHKYRMLPSEYETEYRDILTKIFNVAKY